MNTLQRIWAAITSPNHLPSQSQIGDAVLHLPSRRKMTVTEVHFTKCKVRYNIESLAGERMFYVDSCDVEPFNGYGAGITGQPVTP